MKKRIIKIALASLLVVGLAPVMTSCVDETLNVDPKHPSVLPSENFLATGTYQFAYYTTTPSVNYNNYVFFVQNLSETTYNDETRYNLVTRNQPRNHFNRMYVYVLGNLRNAKEALPKEGFVPTEEANKLATLEISEILVWENLVNTFGNIPYSEALKGNLDDPNFTPKYDDAKTIYKDLINRLDATIASINPSVKGYDGDVIYQGDMNKWIKTANAIKLRLGLNLADTDPALSKLVVESAAQSVYANSGESFTFKYDTGTFTNPFFDNFVASGRNDFVASNTVINLMNEKNDPRLSPWFTALHYALGSATNSTINGTTTTLTVDLSDPVSGQPSIVVGDPIYSNGVLIGNIASISGNVVTIENALRTIDSGSTISYKDYYTGGVFGEKNPFARYSHLSNDFFLVKNKPFEVISYTEVAFMLAEAAARGYNVGGSAADLYAAAITASFKDSGIAGEAAAYLAAHPYEQNTWKKSIGEQAYIALYTKAYATWNFTRRLDYPVLNNPSNSLTTTIPYRMIYSDQEYTLNAANVRAAATAIGGDEVSTKLFWDVN